MVYVDPLINYGWKLGPSCHLTADTLDELNEFASKIGMKLEWLQVSASGVKHYDLTSARRKVAVSKGATELSRREMYERLIAHRALKSQNK